MDSNGCLSISKKKQAKRKESANKCAFFITEFKEIILAQGKAIAELKANSAAQELVTGGCKKEIEALRAERVT